MKGAIRKAENKPQNFGVSIKLKNRSTMNKNMRDVEQWKVIMKDQFARS